MNFQLFNSIPIFNDIVMPAIRLEIDPNPLSWKSNGNFLVLYSISIYLGLLYSDIVSN